jgi:hypothetical protein
MDQINFLTVNNVSGMVLSRNSYFQTIQEENFFVSKIGKFFYCMLCIKYNFVL